MLLKIEWDMIANDYCY